MPGRSRCRGPPSVQPDTRRRPIVPDSWSDFYRQTRIPAAILARGQLRLTGHTGTLPDGTFPEDAEGQIRQTFDNIGQTLRAGGASWDAVVEITSYHVNLEAQGESLLRVAAEFLADPYPAWTAVDVNGFFEPEAIVEISCVALVDE